ncbi:MAG: transcriptional activator NhaR [Planctomycetaceae bacterium]|nr:transcriptional activator NhaR [Planctomycetaceae bacterium]
MTLDQLNFDCLYTFWMVAREGSIARACPKLFLAQPTVSGQLRSLEKTLGNKLFTRAGRGLALTDTGHFVFRHADEIFNLGQELLRGVGGQPRSLPLRLIVGIADVLPKSVTYRLLKPALAFDKVRVVCREGKTDQLLAELALHRLDLVLSDAPLHPSLSIQAFSHLLGESTITIVGVESLAQKFRKNFPASLDQAPFYLPTENTVLRRSMDGWFDANGIRPLVLAEFEDSALMKSFGREGHALMAIPSVVERDVQLQYQLQAVGRIEAIREKFFAISAERRIQHPGVLAVSAEARKLLAK